MHGMDIFQICWDVTRQTEHELLNDKSLYTQSFKFARNLSYGIEYNLDKEDSLKTVFSRPVSLFPKYPGIVIYRSKNVENRREMFFLNLPVIKQLSRFISVLIELLIWISNRDQAKKSIVFVVATHVPFLLAAYLVSRVFSAKYVCYWTDPPFFDFAYESKLKRFARRVDEVCAKWLMRRVDGCVAMTKWLAEDYAPGKPFEVVECIASDEFPEPVYCCDKEIVIMHAGALMYRYGIVNLLEAFMLIKNQDLRLHIYGCGDAEQCVQRAAELDNRIKYFGVVDNRTILERESEADILINPRPVEESFTKYSFPSKTIEYLQSGKAVMSTRLPGITEEYWDYLVSIEDGTPEGIRNAIEELIARGRDTINELGRNGRTFSESKKPIIQGRKVVEFLRDLTK